VSDVLAEPDDSDASPADEPQQTPDSSLVFGDAPKVGLSASTV
jgi:hypothetical protein